MIIEEDSIILYRFSKFRNKYQSPACEFVFKIAWTRKPKRIANIEFCKFAGLISRQDSCRLGELKMAKLLEDRLAEDFNLRNGDLGSDNLRKPKNEFSREPDTLLSRSAAGEPMLRDYFDRGAGKHVNRSPKARFRFLYGDGSKHAIFRPIRKPRATIYPELLQAADAAIAELDSSLKYKDYMLKAYQIFISTCTIAVKGLSAATHRHANHRSLDEEDGRVNLRRGTARKMAAALRRRISSFGKENQRYLGSMRSYCPLTPRLPQKFRGETHYWERYRRYQTGSFRGSHAAARNHPGGLTSHTASESASCGPASLSKGRAAMVPRCKNASTIHHDGKEKELDCDLRRSEENHSSHQSPISLLIVNPLDSFISSIPVYVDPKEACEPHSPFLLNLAIWPISRWIDKNFPLHCGITERSKFNHVDYMDDIKIFTKTSDPSTPINSMSYPQISAVVITTGRNICTTDLPFPLVTSKEPYKHMECLVEIFRITVFSKQNTSEYTTYDPSATASIKKKMSAVLMNKFYLAVGQSSGRLFLSTFLDGLGLVDPTCVLHKMLKSVSTLLKESRDSFIMYAVPLRSSARAYQRSQSTTLNPRKDLILIHNIQVDARFSERPGASRTPVSWPTRHLSSKCHQKFVCHEPRPQQVMATQADHTAQRPSQEPASPQQSSSGLKPQAHMYPAERKLDMQPCVGMIAWNPEQVRELEENRGRQASEVNAPEGADGAMRSADIDRQSRALERRHGLDPDSTFDHGEMAAEMLGNKGYPHSVIKIKADQDDMELPVSVSNWNGYIAHHPVKIRKVNGLNKYTMEYENKGMFRNSKGIGNIFKRNAHAKSLRAEARNAAAKKYYIYFHHLVSKKCGRDCGYINCNSR
ncbi:hypothetical protein RF11_11817 [Thelohanellus kitauei]|uniref:Uncharacterized protein n=1 Tax=Thelohanellus kitauei TaxID=669202 RepID=A0A0C2MWL2_THEKT|nr:hypothetical protein RF11_11817 [Thelohanellus kitauei]